MFDRRRWHAHKVTMKSTTAANTTHQMMMQRRMGGMMKMIGMMQMGGMLGMIVGKVGYLLVGLLQMMVIVMMMR